MNQYSGSLKENISQIVRLMSQKGFSLVTFGHSITQPRSLGQYLQPWSSYITMYVSTTY